MLYRKGRGWVLYPHKVKYTQHGEEVEQWALPNKAWWLDFADKWEHTEIIGFTEIDLTDEQVARFEEIKDMPEDFSELYENYILTGDTSNDFELRINHPFNIVRLRKEEQKLRDENRMLRLQSDMLTDRSDFLEEVITEVILNVVP